MQSNITYRKKDKGWQYIISYKVDGKWKQKSKQGFNSKKEAKPVAERALKELKDNVNSSVDSQCKDMTFEVVSLMYLDHVKLYKEYNTFKAYKTCFFKCYTLNDKQINDIKEYDIQCLVDSFVRAGLKAGTMKEYLRRLKCFFKYAHDLKLMDNIPLDSITVLKKKGVVVKKALTKKELDNLMLKLETNRLYIVAFIAKSTGLRIGEILGLTWNDINCKELTIDVNKQWKRLKNNSFGFGDLKSENAYRIVPVATNTIKTLMAYKNTHITDIYNRVAPFSYASVSKHLNTKLKEFAGISIHELRHTYATTLIHKGLDFKTVAKLLGHDVEQTIKTYSHVNDDMLKNATNIIENIF